MKYTVGESVGLWEMAKWSELTVIVRQYFFNRQACGICIPQSQAFHATNEL